MGQNEQPSQARGQRRTRPRDCLHSEGVDVTGGFQGLVRGLGRGGAGAGGQRWPLGHRGGSRGTKVSSAEKDTAFWVPQVSLPGDNFWIILSLIIHRVEAG